VTRNFSPAVQIEKTSHFCGIFTTVIHGTWLGVDFSLHYT
jgi:hypothetical protein